MQDHIRDAARVGIVGHRPNRPLRSDLHAAIATAFALIVDLAPTDCEISLVSGVAEGADQVAITAVPANWQIEAILPFTREEYAKDFARAADGSGTDPRAAFNEKLAACNRITEIASPREDGAAYLRAGLMMLSTIDVLVAVWDGAHAAGPGGTAEIVRSAVEANIPVIWINSRTKKTYEVITEFAADGTPVLAKGQGEVHAHLLRQLVSPLVARRVEGSAKRTELSERDKADRFFAEPDVAGRSTRIYETVKALLTIGHEKSRSDDMPKDAWDDFLTAAPTASRLHGELKDHVEALYRRSDSLAVYYANTYRSAYVITYGSAFLAVVLALAGLVIPHELPATRQLDIKAILVAAELALVGVIVAVVVVGTRQSWHQKWMDYRSLAEMLRHLRFLAFLGSHRRFGVRDTELSGRHSQWTNDLVGKISRRVGLPDAVIDSAYLTALNSAMREFEVEPQLQYHTKNARTLHVMNHALHYAGNLCFYLTAALLAAFLAFYSIDALFFSSAVLAVQPDAHSIHGGLSAYLYASKSTVGFLAAALPALGAALSGIRFTGEFETFASRSENMALALHEMRKRYGRMAEAASFDRSAATMMETAAILSSDVKNWRTIFTHRRLSLPA